MKKVPSMLDLINKPKEDEGDFKQVTIRVDSEAVRTLKAFADREGIKCNRLFDEAIKLYASIVKGGIRIKNVD
jgi:predicted DNA binding CopG/RHH family protein